jgi:hypothetical protein
MTAMITKPSIWRRSGARLRAVFAVLSAVCVVVWAGASDGLPISPSTDGETSPLVLQVAAPRCVYLEKRQGRDHLVNQCPACRMVKVQRLRPGNPVPSERTYTVMERSSALLSFRGPGRTQVISESSCRPDAPPDTAPQARTQGPKRCVAFHRPGNSGLALMNSCNACFAVLIERIGAGGARSEQVYELLGNSLKALASRGAAQARIVGEIPCKK